MLTEIVPSRIRAQAFSVFTAVNWLSNLFIGLFTLSSINAMGEWLLPEQGGDDSEGGDSQKAGVAGLYAVFAILSIAAVVFIYFFVRETMGKSLEELEGRGGGKEDRSHLSYHLESVGEGREDIGDALLRSEHSGSIVEDGDDSCRVAL